MKFIRRALGDELSARDEFYGLPPPASPIEVPSHAPRHFLLKRERENYLDILRVRVLINSTVTINDRLPVELLVAIMKLVQDMDENWWRMLQVCRRWFVIGASAPGLWTHPRVGTNGSFLSTCLDRSRGLPLNLYVVEGIPSVPEDLPQRLQLHASQIVRLRVDLPYREWGDGPESPGRRLLSLMGTPMPNLQILKVSAGTREVVNDVPECEPKLVLSAERFPKLCELYLRRVHLSYDSSALRHLKVFQYRQVAGIIPPLSYLRLAIMLRKCKLVDNLVLENILNDTPIAPIDFNSSNINRIELSATLSKITLVLHAPLLNSLLALLKIPPAARVRIVRTTGGEPSNDELATGVRAVLPQDRLGTLPILRDVTHVEVFSFKHKSVLTGSAPALSLGGEIELALQVGRGGEPRIASMIREKKRRPRPPHALPPSLPDLVDIFGGSPVEDLSIRIDETMLAQADWSAILAAFPALRSLTVSVLALDRTDRNVDMNSVDELLHVVQGLETKVQEQPPRMVCHGLRRLHFEGFGPYDHTFLDRLVGCINRRKEAQTELEELIFTKNNMRSNNGPEIKSLFENTLSAIVQDVIYHNHWADL
ncbi:hypothetical protein C8Q76DRAFT_738215 [Earliella scabrosa]|nr:hypothetical protein C8Q76DRAFT_738215 [Earliella scabrosa]